MKYSCIPIYLGFIFSLILNLRPRIAKTWEDHTPFYKKDIIENLSISVFDDNISYVVAKDKKNNTIGHIVIDKVYGKHEIIVYAVAIKLDGTVKMVEILEYNESYGEGVLDKEWKDQFVGRTQNDNFKLNDGVIQNVSGSTISCKHVSDGVKRTLAFYNTVINDKKK